MLMEYLLGPCGGLGGDQRNMHRSPANRIIKVQIRHENAINGINILYQPPNDGSVWTNWWGGSGGQFSEINLDPDEFLTGVSGYYGPLGNINIIRELTFASNKRIYGPFGRGGGGVLFSLMAPEKIVAFTARSGEFLDAIGVYVV